MEFNYSEHKNTIVLHELIRYLVNQIEQLKYLQISVSSLSALTIHTILLEPEAEEFKYRTERHFRMKYRASLSLEMSRDFSANNNDYDDNLLYFTTIDEDLEMLSIHSVEEYIMLLALEILNTVDVSQIIKDTS